MVNSMNSLKNALCHWKTSSFLRKQLVVEHVLGVNLSNVVKKKKKLYILRNKKSRNEGGEPCQRIRKIFLCS